MVDRELKRQSEAGACGRDSMTNEIRTARAHVVRDVPARDLSGDAVDLPESTPRATRSCDSCGHRTLAHHGTDSGPSGGCFATGGLLSSERCSCRLTCGQALAGSGH